MKKDYAFEWRITQLARELRKNSTPEEKKMWSLLRNKRLGEYKFRRQHPIKRFIVGFYCHQCQLIVEVDACTTTRLLNCEMTINVMVNCQYLGIWYFGSRTKEFEQTSNQFAKRFSRNAIRDAT